jgi:hypothetical protein
MIDRRQFLSAGLLVALPTLAAAARVTGSGDATSPALFVCDLRCAAEVAVPAIAALSSATAVCTLQGDVSPAWFGVLRPHMAASRAPVAGLTLGDALFCLQRLAADIGWRLERCHHAGRGTDVEPLHLAADDTPYAWRMAPGPTA